MSTLDVRPSSPETFLRTFRTLSNIEHASAAWANQDLYIPSKPQLITSWALTHLLKHGSAIRDERIWSLLDSILSSNPSFPPPWLPALLYKIPTVPILTSLLRSFDPPTEGLDSNGPFIPYKRVMDVILPIAFPKTRFDTILDCLWASLETISGSNDMKNIESLALYPLKGFRNTFSAHSNKAKVYSEFVEAHMDTWLLSISKAKDRPALKQALWEVGDDILLSIEAIKILSQSLDDGHGYFAQLQSICSINPQLLNLTVTLFQKQINAVRLHRSTLEAVKLQISPARLFTFYSKTFMAIDDGLALLAQLKILQSLGMPPEIDVHNTDWSLALRSNLEWCILAITSSAPNVSDTAINILAVLGRLEYTLLLPHVVTILRAVATIPSGNISCSSLLEIVIAYHSKTRTLDQFCDNLIDVAKSPLYHGGTPFPPIQIIPSLLNGCVFGVNTLELLSEGISQFLTPGQITPVLRKLVSALEQSSLNILQNGANYQDIDQLALSSACFFRIATSVVPYLPISRLQFPVQDTKSSAEIIGSQIIRSNLQQCFRSPAESTWSSQNLAISILQFTSSLQESDKWINIDNYLDEGILIGAETTLITASSLSIELEIELVNLLLSHALPEVKIRVFQHILDRFADLPDREWNGKLSGMSFSGLKCAYWCLISGRKISLFASLGTPKQLRQFSMEVIATFKDTPVIKSSEFVTASAIIYQLFKNATFWELKTLQGILVEELLSRINNCELQGYENFESNAVSNATTLEELGRYYKILMMVPHENFQSGIISNLAQKAIISDYAASRLSSTSPLIAELRIVFRTFVSRHLTDGSSSFRNFISSTSALGFLCTSTVIDDPQGLFGKATLAIVEVAATVFLQKEIAPLVTLNDVFRLPVTILDIVESSNLQLECWASCLFAVPRVTKGKHISEIESVVDDLLGILLEALQSHSIERVLLPAVLQLLRAVIGVQMTILPDVDGTKIKRLSTLLLTIGKDNRGGQEDLPLYLEIFLIQVDIWRFRSNRIMDSSVLVALYVVAISEIRFDDRLDEQFGIAIRSMDAQEYENTLKLVMDATHSESQSKVPPLLHAFSVLLRYAPEGTFLVTKIYSSQIFDILLTETSVWNGETICIKRAILRHILSISQDKPALLQHKDVGNILTLLVQMVQPSSDHPFDQTQADIFHETVKATGALIRNRKDFVFRALPHLAYLLRLLMSAFGATRANLGLKQRRAILGTLPPWVSLSEPLGAQEAAALARLLTNMITKTPSRSRSHTSSKFDTQSFLKPFGKHASSVLASYIELATRQTCFISRQVRFELAPGIHALCAMSGERGRDALMASLTPEGRAVLKSLWEAYEKQRYTGQG
ncbi:hypothetical protein FRC14_007512 [Serendipita sp. 396]|nr:hypothetical protein FRC14_007512 [Serendipita sp. 396]KAG8801824.1 hypothetical protein FRC16_011025 [Serendipita sp. 398]